MNLKRLGASFAVEVRHSFTRPLFWVLALVMILMGWGLSTGSVQISSGDSSVGGTKAWLTSEFAQTQMMSFIVLLLYGFFIAVAGGLTLLNDRESKVDVLLHATPLTPGEYVWGRYLGVLVSFSWIFAVQIAATMFFNHIVPNGHAVEMRGPFNALNYLKPVLFIGAPFLLFFAAVSMWIGEKSRNAVVVFVLPVAALLACGFFLWTWSPSWLDPRVNKLLQVIDPTGYRWLNETLLKVDRGVSYYNHEAVPYGGLFWLNRLVLLVGSAAAVFGTQRLIASSQRGAVVSKAQAAQATANAEPVAARAPEEVQSLGTLGMKGGRLSFLDGIKAVARAEVRELLFSPGMYIFIPIILIQVLGTMFTAVGPFDTPLLFTPGMMAVGITGQITTLVCLLLLFYTVESLRRERAVNLDGILYATPLRTGAFLAGKAIANSLIGAAILVAALLACIIGLAVQHTVSFSLTPFALVWGLMVIPTFLVWSAFVIAVFAVVNDRYATYAIALGALIFTGYRAVTGQINWAGNWPLWNSLRWSDIAPFEADRLALVLNRVEYLSLAVFFTALAVHLFARRGADPVRVLHRLQPKQLAMGTLRLSPYMAVPLIAGVALGFQVSTGFEGGKAKKAAKNYWGKNIKTYLDAPLPDIARAVMNVKVDPAKSGIVSDGTLTLTNPLDSTMARFPVTAGLHWKHVKWTLNGKPYTPEDRQHLYVFTPPAPLAKGDSVVLGWHFDGRFPDGVSKNGGNQQEFILPSGVVLTGFTPSFMPVLGFKEGVGEDKDNESDARWYPRDYYKTVARATYGATAWFPARIRVTVPESFTANSVGVCTANTVKDGWRTQTWETDHPVKILNIVAGQWQVKRGRENTAVFYNAQHPYNIDQMVTTLDASRKYFSQWFLPYPWRELKLSEFPGMAGYAQGFGTDITFSENIGFLTRNTAKTDATCLVTAHETAHQWWGNILTPYDGTNGDFLSEGMAHFSTLLLFEQLRGPRGRMEFAKGIEARYADRRRVDSERPMYDVDGKRPSDTTVIYDRGGWVFWMLYDFMGHDRALAGVQNFIRTWSVSRDHAALQDFVAAMRPYAADPVAYDAFVEQWFDHVVVPEYKLTDAKKVKRGSGYDVTVTVRNAGTARMPVEVAAVTDGDRWITPKDTKAIVPYKQSSSYRDARATVTLGAGESKTVTLHCAFAPAKIVVDPDVRVLQLNRKNAVASL